MADLTRRIWVHHVFRPSEQSGVVVPFSRDVFYQRMPPFFSLPLLRDEELQDTEDH